MIEESVCTISVIYSLAFLDFEIVMSSFYQHIEKAIDGTLQTELGVCLVYVCVVTINLSFQLHTR